MNIYDVSKKAGVSIATVSRVINGNEKVSEKTKQKVLAVIEEFGYTPNAFARGLGLNSMQTVGILCPDSSDPHLANSIYYLERELRQHGYDSILCCTGYQLETKQKYLTLLLSKRVDAVIFVGSSFIETENKYNDYILEAANKVPVMLLNGFLDGKNIYSTVCDDYQVVYNATNQMIASGMKDILYLYHSFTYSTRQKISGYQAALKANQLPIREEYMQSFSGTLTETKNFLQNLRKQGLFFNGVVAADDSLAVSALKYAKACQLLVPEELSIIGYNNSIIGECCEPELTTVDNKVETSCIIAVTTLMRVFSGNNVPAKTMVSADILQRGTTIFKN